MKVLYYDCFAGISGDMNLSALVDLYGNEEEIKQLILQLFSEEVEIEFQDVNKKGISAKKLTVKEKNKQKDFRHLHDIENLINNSSVSDFVKQKSLEIFNKIALAEAKVHNIPVEKVHFHEIGAVDTIVDIVGGVFLLERLKVAKIYSSKIEIGSGKIKIEHGVFPVPAPATAEILKNIPIVQTLSGEATTPTGAAIISSIVNEFSFPQKLKIEKIGYGAGERDTEIPNVLRIFLGELDGEKTEEETLIEVNIDDTAPERMEYIMDRLFENGALDVFFTPIIMKKSRPAFLISVLCEKQKEPYIEQIIFEETTTFGLRKTNVTKKMLEREIVEMKTHLGTVRVKRGYYNGKLIKQKFEYEDVRKICKEKNISFDEAIKILSTHCI
ncbi:MAG: nickel pincer cofactor biosynthesis protein LarC [Brevinematales bacterium]|nr:nickel pincer cofactor biosynthesis protein LarC [Brevinematales bacterium]